MSNRVTPRVIVELSLGLLITRNSADARGHRRRDGVSVDQEIALVVQHMPLIISTWEGKAPSGASGALTSRAPVGVCRKDSTRVMHEHLRNVLLRAPSGAERGQDVIGDVIVVPCGRVRCLSGCLVNWIFMGRGAPWEHERSVANFGAEPVRVACAASNALNPSIGRVTRFTAL